MYILIRSAKNLIRRSRRTVVTLLLFSAVLSVMVCQFFYLGHYSNVLREMEEICSSSFYIAFRDDLQYLGSRRISSLQDDGSSYILEDGTAVKSFDSEAMAVYDHPYPVTREMFEEIADVPYVLAHDAAYMTTAYGAYISDVPGAVRAFASGEHGTQFSGTVAAHVVFGGEAQTLERSLAEQDPASVWDYVLTQGRMPESDGECCITEAYAQLCGVTVGGSLPLYDVQGELLQTLRITGLMKLYVVESTADSMKDKKEVRDIGAPDLNDLFAVSGTPYDRITEDMESRAVLKARYPSAYIASSSLLCVIFTTYDAAYNFYGTAETDPLFAEHHHFNHYINYYTIRDQTQTDAWIGHIRSVFPSEFAEEFTAYDSFRTYAKRSWRPLMMVESCGKTILYAACFALFILFITTLVTRRECRHETEILCSLGIADRKIRLTYALENAMLAMIGCAVSSAAAGTFHAGNLQTAAPGSFVRAEQLVYRLPMSALLLAAAAIVSAFFAGYLLCVPTRVHKHAG